MTDNNSIKPDSNDDDHPTMRLGKEWDKKAKTYRPILHVLFSDGRTTDFHETPIILPEPSKSEADEQVLAMLVNGKGEPWLDGYGKPVLLPTIPIALNVLPCDKELLTWKEARVMANTSLSTLKRAVEQGAIERVYLGGNDGLPRIKTESLNSWMSRKRGEISGKS